MIVVKKMGKSINSVKSKVKNPTSKIKNKKLSVKTRKKDNKKKSTFLEKKEIKKEKDKKSRNFENKVLKEKKDSFKLNEKNNQVKCKEILTDGKIKVIKKIKFSKKTLIRYCLILILLCVLIFSVTKLVFNEIDMFKSRANSKKLIKEVISFPTFIPDNNEESPKEDYIPKPEEVSVNFNKLLSINSDTIGWMMFNNMKINNPIVHTYDNEYYLNHNFYKSYSEAGTIFMDYRNSSFDDKNVVLFGHSNLDGTMFGSLYDVFKSNYFSVENADIIYFYDTNNNLLKYQIFSYYTIDVEEYYITTYFASDEYYQSFIDTIKARSFGYRNVNVTSSDKILTLSTCAGNTFGGFKRRVIHAKRI